MQEVFDAVNAHNRKVAEAAAYHVEHAKHPHGPKAECRVVNVIDDPLFVCDLCNEQEEVEEAMADCYAELSISKTTCDEVYRKGDSTINRTSVDVCMNCMRALKGTPCPEWNVTKQ